MVLVLQEQRLRYLKQQEQRQQQQASEQEKLLRLRENIENQETRLKKVRALKGQVEQKRLSNGKLGMLTDAVISWRVAPHGFIWPPSYIGHCRSLHLGLFFIPPQWKR